MRTQSRLPGAFVAMIGSLFLLAAAGTLFGFVLPQSRAADASLSWPKAQGVVEQVYIREAIRNISDEEAQIRYRYQVDQQQLEGHKISFGLSSLSDYTQYAEGQVVEVSYDPEDPSTAVLIAGPQGSAWMPWLIFVCGPALVGLIAWLVALSMFRRAKKTNQALRSPS